MLRIFLLSVILASSSCLYAQNSIREAREVIHRFAGEFPAKLKLSFIDKENSCDVFETKVRNGELEIRGSSGVALCRGFYDFIKSNHAGISAWSGNRCIFPASLPENMEKRVVSPFPRHYYYNVVTYGYTLPYWDWQRWEEEIDWMALHGVDMPLALVANEAITARVWKRLGLTEEEIQSYFVGPAHLPWMRMGNISQIDGPMPVEWHSDQVELQHKILKRMKLLGMKPICPAFAGFVPLALKRLYPDVKIIETTWAGFHNWMLSPEEELFTRIGQLFIEEWEKEFGKNDFYLADSFNEMDVPFPPIGTKERYDMLAFYGEQVYKGIKAGNPDAVWVMQGWMFGYQRDIWDYETLQALVNKVPDDKMMLLDLAADYNKNVWGNGMNWEFYKGFFNKLWVYSVIPNMGGKTGATGILSFYANGHLEALNSPNRGRLFGFGMAPEGTENNEVVYEMICDAGWSSSEIDVKQWLKDYSLCRYGKTCPEMDEVWEGLCKSVYGTFTDHPRFLWQLRPGRSGKGTVNTDSNFYRAVEKMAECAPKMTGSPLFKADFLEMTAFYLGGKMEALASAIGKSYLYGNTADALKMQQQFEELGEGLDSLLESHPVYRLQRWIDFARKHGDTEKLKDYYEMNARRIVTIWGPPVSDYACKLWSGLIRDYYLPRWREYFRCKETGSKYDLASWESDWVTQKKGVSPMTPYADPVEAAIRWIQKAKEVEAFKEEETVIGYWTPSDVSTTWKDVIYNIPAEKLPVLRGILFEYVRGARKLDISEVTLVADGKEVCKVVQNGTTGDVNRDNFFYFQIPEGATGNNECYIRARVQSDGDADSYGEVRIILAR